MLGGLRPGHRRHRRHLVRRPTGHIAIRVTSTAASAAGAQDMGTFGALITRGTNDVQQVQMVFVMALSFL